ncbi:MAG: EAL domain-containing protein [Qipengyuania sp.]
MGAMPFSELFKGRKPAGVTADALNIEVDQSDKLAIVADLEASGVSWFWATDPKGRITYLSPSVAAALQTDISTLLGQSMQTVFVPAAGETEGRSLGLKLGSRKSFAGLTVRASKSGTDLVLKLSGRPVHSPSAEFQGYRGSAIDVTEEFRAEEEAARLAQFDSLTGLANRHRMENRIDSTLAAFRQSERSCAVMMMDLDRFKQVNDTLGHAAGDQLLQQVAERLRTVLASRGEIGRLGGDEFQVLIPDMDDRGELGEFAKKIITMVSQPYSVDEGRCTIGCSVGVAIAPYDGVDREELTRSADLALYAAKNGGRGQFRFYAADLEHDANLRKRMEVDLADAIENGSFVLRYQPVVATDGNQVVALDAQYFWTDEERGIVEPEIFLPVAEGSRLIVPIGEWGVRKACQDAAAWPSALRVSIRITAVQFGADGFVNTVEQALKDAGLDPSRLDLLLCESILQGDPTAIDKTVSALFKLGVRLTLDQFGSGFSSLSYIRRTPFAALKIGANFFEPTTRDPHGDMEMVQAIVSLASAMGMETFAAGVHAKDLLSRLTDQGVHYIQGFVFSDAIDAERVGDELGRGEWTLAPTDTGAQRASRRTVLRRIGLIHEDYYYDVTLRNLSRSGAMIQGLEAVPAGTQCVLDFGGGQLAVATVRRTMDDTQGVEFEQELVDDGAGGLCTRHRVSPYDLAAAGVPLQALPAGKYSAATLQFDQKPSIPQFSLSTNAPEQTGREAA